MIPTHRSWTIALTVLALLLALAPPGFAADGPGPSLDPAASAGQAVGENTQGSAGLAAAYALFAAEQSLAIGDATLEALVEEGFLRFPQDELVALFDRLGEDGVHLVDLFRSSVLVAKQGGEDQVAEDLAAGDLALQALQRKTGVGVEPGAGVPLSPAGPTGCVTDIQAALDQAAPGEEIPVCPGTYEGPFHVRQHFVSLRGIQGPRATTIDASQGQGVVIEASGVIVSGFTIEGADGPSGTAVAIQAPDFGVVDRAEAAVTGNLVRGNVLTGNTHAVTVVNATATTIVGNVIRDASALHPPSVGAIVVGAPVTAETSLATVVAANTFLNNAGLAIRATAASEAPAPTTVAIGNYFGSTLGPNVEVPGMGACFGPQDPQGDPTCRNGVGAGVLHLGHSPVPL